MSAGETASPVCFMSADHVWSIPLLSESHWATTEDSEKFGNVCEGFYTLFIQ